MAGLKIKKYPKKNSKPSKKIVFDSRSLRSRFFRLRFHVVQKRGRPKKSAWFHFRKNWILRVQKTARWYRRWQIRWHGGKEQLRRLFGLARGRGRPRKFVSPIAAIRTAKHKKSRAFLIWYRATVRPLRHLLHWVLQALHLRRRRGRPKKSQPRRHVIFPSFHFRWKTLLTILFLCVGAYGVWWGYQFVFAGLPSVLDLTQKDPFLTTKIVDRNGKLLFRVYEDENRTLVPLSAISEHLINATIAIEDKDFYNHHGFSVVGIVRAAWANLQGEEIQQGGSTITQQLVKNRLLTPERTLKRKLRELVLSVVAEGVYSKEEILEMYLNQVAYGGSTYGAEEASWRYFHKSARNLNLAEAALLAGLPQAPSVYSPFSSNPELAFARQEEVLRRMAEDGFITQEQLKEAAATPIVFAEDRTDIQAPHFVMYVKRLLAEKFGENMVQTGGLEVRTTLDLDVQKAAEQILREELDRLAPLNVGNGAILITNPQTGEILAMVGSRDYFDFTHDGQVNVVLRPRQPGSSIKPLTYALALESGLTPNTIIEDSPVVYQTVGSPPYAPKNYDGKFHGRVTLREALASSYNVPAVKTLAGLGVSTMLDRGEEVGITTWRDRNRFGLSLTLGGGEVTMLELSQLYGTFANNGGLVRANPLLEVRNQRGERLYQNPCVADTQNCVEKDVFDAATAYQITDILSDNRARTPAFGPQSVLHIPGQEVAVKTGTTNSLRDNWTIGYTTDRLVAVWVGNNNNTPMSSIASGITGASPIWNRTMRLLLSETKPHVFTMPDDVVEVNICQTTGTLPCRGCPLMRTEVFRRGTEPQQACSPAQFLPTPTPTPAVSAQ